jgi:GDPmannose 4,6-dehydratase
MKKAIIFGVNGQDGFYLQEQLQANACQVYGVPRSNGVDITKFQEVERLVKDLQPHYIFHLAANSTTRHEALFENHETISTGTLNILESVKKQCPVCRVFITGSGVQFVNKGSPISEKDEFAPLSAYAVSRIHSVYAARYYRSLGIKTYVGYLFHHESPLRKPPVSAKVYLNLRSVSGRVHRSKSCWEMSLYEKRLVSQEISPQVFGRLSVKRLFSKQPLELAKPIRFRNGSRSVFQKSVLIGTTMLSFEQMGSFLNIHFSCQIQRPFFR